MFVGHHCTHGFIPDWDEHVLPWPKNNTQNLINFKCTCFLCIATTGRTMFCMGGILNVGQCGSSQPGMTHMHHSQSWPRLVTKHFNLIVQHQNMFSTIFRSQKSHPGLGWLVLHHFTHGFIPVWDDITTSDVSNLPKIAKKNVDFTFFTTSLLYFIFFPDRSFSL